MLKKFTFQTFDSNKHSGPLVGVCNVSGVYFFHLFESGSKIVFTALHLGFNVISALWSPVPFEVLEV